MHEMVVRGVPATPLVPITLPTNEVELKSIVTVIYKAARKNIGQVVIDGAPPVDPRQPDGQPAPKRRPLRVRRCRLPPPLARQLPRGVQLYGRFEAELWHLPLVAHGLH